MTQDASTATSGPDAVTGPGQLTPDWLAAALAGGDERIGGVPTAVTTTPVGTGQVADTFRLHVTWDPPTAGPASLIAKVTAADEASRMAALLARTYEIEVGFYHDLAADLPLRTPQCFHAVHDVASGAYTVLLEDLAPAVQGDQMAGCGVDQAAAALDEMALLHAPRWADTSLEGVGWLHRSIEGAAEQMGGFIGGLVPGFLERYGDQLDASVVALVERLAPRLPAYLADRPRPWTVVHGDFRLDNLLFGPDRVAVVDWQTVGLGPAIADLSYFIGAGLVPDDRRAHERDLVAYYGRAMRTAGVAAMDDETCWEGYRRHAFGGLVMAIIASMLVTRTDRGDLMFIAMADRHGLQALDLGSEALVAG